jgi:hypothetical protein
VYIISNIGSFGENIYKIGVTRRLAPEDRIDFIGNKFLVIISTASFCGQREDCVNYKQ